MTGPAPSGMTCASTREMTARDDIDDEMTSTNDMQSTREVERKYEAADEVPYPDPSRLLGAENIGAAEDQ